MPTVSAAPSRARRAFTLIELLTVIAIIGILAAIIIPTVGKVRDTAKSANCSSNLRQIGMALNLYANENKGKYPAASRDFDAALGDTGGGSTVPWSKALGPYLPRKGNTTTAPAHQIFTCPSADYNGLTGSDISVTYVATSAMIGLNSTGTRASTVKVPRTVASIDSSRPSLIPFVVEGKVAPTSTTAASSSYNWTTVSSDFAQASEGDTDYLDFRHGGRNRMNILYVDGSVRRSTFSEIKLVDEKTWSGLPL